MESLSSIAALPGVGWTGVAKLAKFADDNDYSRPACARVGESRTGYFSAEEDGEAFFDDRGRLVRIDRYLERAVSGEPDIRREWSFAADGKLEEYARLEDQRDLSRYRFSYDGAGKLVEFLELRGGDGIRTEYSYDERGRVSRNARDVGGNFEQVFDFHYDGRGLFSHHSRPSASQDAEIGELDERIFTYDDDGNQIELLEGSTRRLYEPDADGWLLSRTTIRPDEPQEKWVYERDSDGAILNTRVMVGGENGVFEEVRGYRMTRNEHGYKATEEYYDYQEPQKNWSTVYKNQCF